LRPQYAAAIIDGSKTVELRRRFTNRPVVLALIYVSKTDKAITARAVVKKVEKLPVSSLWRIARDTAAVSRGEFDRYLHDIEIGYAITLGRIEMQRRPVTLTELLARFDLRPPQSFMFAPRSLVRRAAKR
jgi:predicted transcriptional regulator